MRIIYFKKALSSMNKSLPERNSWGRGGFEKCLPGNLKNRIFEIKLNSFVYFFFMEVSQ